MNENLPTNVQLDANQNGSVTFATDVIATIAGLAANEVEGVASMTGGSGGLADILGRGRQASRNFTKGVKVEVSGNQVAVTVSLVIDYGSPVPEVAANIQENVKKAIETMSGLTVTNVDIHVQGVSFERENRAAAQIEAHPRVLLQKQEPEAEQPKAEPAKDAQSPSDPENEKGSASSDEA